MADAMLDDLSQRSERLADALKAEVEADSGSEEWRPMSVDNSKMLFPIKVWSHASSQTRFRTQFVIEGVNPSIVAASLSNIDLFPSWNKTTESIVVVETRERTTVTAMTTKATGPVSGRAVLTCTNEMAFSDGSLARVTLNVDGYPGDPLDYNKYVRMDSLEQVTLLEPADEGTRFTQTVDLNLALSWVAPQAMIYSTIASKLRPRDLNKLARIILAEGDATTTTTVESQGNATSNSTSLGPHRSSSAGDRPPRRSIASAASVEKLAKEIANMRGALNALSTKLDVVITLVTVLLLGRLARAVLRS